MFDNIINFEEIKNYLMKIFSGSFDFLNDDNVQKEIDGKVNEFENNIKSHIEKENPFENDYRVYRRSYNDFKYNGADEDSILDDINNYKKFGGNDEFYNKKLDEWRNKYKDKNNNDEKNSKETDINAIRKSVLDDWKKSLDEKYMEWALNEIDKKREEFFKNMKDYFEKLKSIIDLEKALGEETGVLFDLSLGKLLKKDIEYIKKLASFIEKHENIKKLCDMLGRFFKEEENYKKEKVFRKETFHTKVPDINSEEEIVGITYSRDIHNMLPQEKLLFADGVLETLFGVKYLENSLLTFKKEGYADYSYDEMIEDEKQVAEEDKKGPIIICVDTSGSMSGVPETIAKAVTLYLATRAMKQKRNCYLINFSTKIHTTDLTYPNTIDNLLDFLRLSFDGGTDAIPALRHAVKIMNNENYKKADLMFISDFVFNNFTDEDFALVNKQKENKNQFYSLTIGSNSSLMMGMPSLIRNMPLSNLSKSIFDYNWVYDPASSSVKDITGKMYSSMLYN